MILATTSPQSPVLTITVGVLTLLLAPATAWLTFKLVKKRELAEGVQAEVARLDLVRKPEMDLELRKALEQARGLSIIASDAAREERVRHETLRWANPILNSVRGLQGRLDNILRRAGYVALTSGGRGMTGWSVTYEYFMSSTLYLFASYFGYIELLRGSLSHELFATQEDKEKLFDAIGGVSDALRAYPPQHDTGPTDTQVFALQQQALGELMIDRSAIPLRCLSYPQFLRHLNEPAFDIHVQPVRALLEAVSPNDGPRWARIGRTKSALDALATACEQLLGGTASK